MKSNGVARAAFEGGGVSTPGLLAPRGFPFCPVDMLLLASGQSIIMDDPSCQPIRVDPQPRRDRPPGRIITGRRNDQAHVGTVDEGVIIGPYMRWKASLSFSLPSSPPPNMNMDSILRGKNVGYLQGRIAIIREGGGIGRLKGGSG